MFQLLEAEKRGLKTAVHGLQGFVGVEFGWAKLPGRGAHSSTSQQLAASDWPLAKPKGRIRKRIRLRARAQNCSDCAPDTGHLLWNTAMCCLLRRRCVVRARSVSQAPGAARWVNLSFRVRRGGRGICFRVCHSVSYFFLLCFAASFLFCLHVFLPFAILGKSFLTCSICCSVHECTSLPPISRISGGGTFPLEMYLLRAAAVMPSFLAA